MKFNNFKNILEKSFLYTLFKINFHKKTMNHENYFKLNFQLHY